MRSGDLQYFLLVSEDLSPVLELSRIGTIANTPPEELGLQVLGGSGHPSWSDPTATSRLSEPPIHNQFDTPQLRFL